MIQYKKNIVDRMGGPVQYGMIVYEMSERMLEDRRLGKLLHGLSNVNDLCELQTSVLDLALGEMDETEMLKLHNRATLQHYRLFQLGLTGSHFEIIKKHLVEALQYSWTDKDILDDILECFEPLKDSFYQKGSIRTQTTRTSGGEYHFGVGEFQLMAALQKNALLATNTNGNKEPRRVSGENLLAMLRVNLVKRPRISPVATAVLKEQ